MRSRERGRAHGLVHGRRGSRRGRLSPQDHRRASSPGSARECPRPGHRSRGRPRRGRRPGYRGCRSGRCLLRRPGARRVDGRCPLRSVAAAGVRCRRRRRPHRGGRRAPARAVGTVGGGGRRRRVGGGPGRRAGVRAPLEGRAARGRRDRPLHHVVDAADGETGTGKEVVARLVHELDARPRCGELVLLDCTTIVPSLSGSEFFGHVKGAFTGASTPRSGAFEMADGGTLFLDEVGELPADLQAALLRVVQEGTYKPVGGTRWQRTSFRLLAATNRDLRAECDAGPVPPRPLLPAGRRHRAAAAAAGTPRGRRPALPSLPRRGTTGPAAARARPRRGRVARAAGLPGQRARPPPARGPGGVPGTSATDRSAPATSRRTTGRVRVRRVPDSPAPVTTPRPDTWDEQLERAVRLSLRSGVGLKRLRTLVSDIATGVATSEADGPAAAARMLGISRRALDYRTANGAAPAQAARPARPPARRGTPRSPGIRCRRPSRSRP